MSTRRSNARFFLDIDHDCRPMLIPVERRKEWADWIDANEMTYRPKLPAYAIKVGADSHRVEFECPTYRGKRLDAHL